MISKYFLYIMFILLASCGSDGKKSNKPKEKPETELSQNIESPPENEALMPETLTITAEQSTLFTGQTESLTASATYPDGTTEDDVEDVEWSSGDETIAKVSQSGKVTAIATGEVEIFAEIEDASDSISFTVLPSSVGFTAWVGKEDTQVSIDATASFENLAVYASSVQDCDPIECEGAFSSPVTANEPITVTTHTLDNSVNYQLKMDGYKSGKSVLSDIDIFSLREYHQSVVFSDAMYVIGGLDKSGSDESYLNDIWQSDTGEKWQLTIGAADFKPREGHQVTAFNDTLYLTGGWAEGDKEYNDVWRSDNAIDWEQITEAAAFKPRDSHQVVTFNNKMYLIAGWTEAEGCNSFNDVWESSDGETWTSITDNAGFSKRCSHQAIVYKDTFYVIAGLEGKKDSRKYLNDVWTSTDGIAWKKETLTNPFPARFKHQVVVFKSALFLSGGFNGNNNKKTYYNDVWRSQDGKAWQKLTDSASFPARSNHQMMALNGMLYIIAGKNDTTVFNDVWRSDDGIQWYKRVRGEFTIDVDVDVESVE